MAKGTKKYAKKMRSTTMKSHHYYPECPDATFYGLQKWGKHLFEELGWMVLAKEYGMLDKVAVYKASIRRIKCALEKKIKHLRDYDKKEDLRLLHHNICCLMEHVDKDFQ
jgi:hypothetical protein